MCSPQPAPVTLLGGVGSRCRPRCDCHEARAGLSPFFRVVSYGSAMEVWAFQMRLLSLPACTQRSVRRGAALASRLDPLVPSGDERGRSKALFFASLHGAFIADSNFCNLENPGALGHGSSLCAVTRQQLCGCVHRMLRFGLACILPPSSLEGVGDEIESWIAQDLLKASASTEPVSGSDYCLIGMPSIVSGNINAVARSLNARSSSITALFCPLTKTIGDVRIDDLIIRSALQLSTVCVESFLIEVQRAPALHDFLVFAVGVSRTLLQGPLGRWALALSFRLKVFTSLDGAFLCSRHFASHQAMSRRAGACLTSFCVS